MNFVLHFLHITSWVAILIASVVIYATYAAKADYYSKDNLQRALDQFNGIRRTWSYRFYPFLLVISILFLIAYYTR